MRALGYTKGLFCDAWVYCRSSFGRMLREAGLDFDHMGANLQSDIAHM